jgi:hypothetical protein
MKKRFLFLLIGLAFCTAALFAQPVKTPREMNVQEAVYKAMQLDANLADKKAALEKGHERKFKQFEDEFKVENEKLNKQKKDEFETTSEFNTRVEAERVKLSNVLQEKKDNYLQTVYNVEKDGNVVKLQQELDDVTSQTYPVPNGYYKIIVNAYDADSNFFDVTFNYYSRTDIDKVTNRNSVVMDKISLKWEIEREKAIAISKIKPTLILGCRASLFKSNGVYVFDKYEISIADPADNSPLFNSVFFRNKKLNVLPAVKNAGAYISTISASSILTEKADKNQYQPVKMFDGKPDTGWAEKANGPGIGEWVEVKFLKPVTADKLVVQPGWFNKLYWITNNRLKTLMVELDGFTMDMSFKDQMIPQEVVLPGPKVFTRARFIIKEVYKTAKDDDSCMTEIEFWNSNKKIELDISAFADQFKVVPE